MKRKIKVFGTILLIGILENILFALFLGAALNRTVIFSTVLFTVVLTFILDKLELIREC